MNDVRELEFWTRVEAHHGLLTRAEGVHAFGPKGFEIRVRRGQFVRVHRGVYRVAGAPIGPRQELVALTWALRAYASHRSAAFMHTVFGFTLDRLEITRPVRSNFTRELQGLSVRAHRSTFLPAHHITTIDSIQCTTLARTLCDLSAVISLPRLERIIDNCKRLGMIEYADIAACRLEIKAQGRRRTTYLDAILEARVPGFMLGESPPEDKIRRWLEAEGFQPVAQFRTVVNGERRRLDLALPDDKVAIEYQGIDAHSTHGAVVNDSAKITELQLAGWFVVLVTKKTTRAVFRRQVREALEIQRAAAAYF